MSATTGGGTSNTVPFLVTVLPKPVLSATPNPLDFGSVVIGTSRDLNLTIKNTGEGTLEGSCTAAAPFSLPEGCAFNLSAGQSKQVKVRFSPATPVFFSSNISIISNGGSASPIVKGQGTTNKPYIQNLSLLSGPVGTSVTIVGLNFVANQGNSTVKFGTKRAKITSWSNTQIQVTVPSATPGAYDVTVTTKQGSSNAVSFTITAVQAPTPTITKIRPTYGPAGTEVTITGKNFGNDQGLSTVRFGDALATINAWSNTQIKAVTPVLPSGTVPVTVKVAGKSSNNDQTFTYRSQSLPPQCQGFFSSSKKDCNLLAKLQDAAYFNIPNTVPGDQLLKYIRKHEASLTALLTQIDHGRTVDLFLKGQIACLQPAGEVDSFVKAGGDVFDVIKGIVDILQLRGPTLALNVVSESLDILSIIVEGFKVYKLAVCVITAVDTRAILQDYINDRSGAVAGSTPKSKEASWQDISSFYDVLLPLVSANSGVPPDKLNNWFEHAFVAYRFVGFPDSASIRYAEGLAIAQIALTQ